MTRSTPRSFALVLALTAVTLVACAKTSKVITSTSTTVATTAPAATIAMATNPKLGAILVDAEGRTLYHNTKETGTTIVCTGSCADTWPPIIAPTGGATAASGVPGTLGTVARPDGTTQVTYNGEPLYLFANDHAAGDVNGQGIGGVWFVVPPAANGAAATLSGSTTTAG